MNFDTILDVSLALVGMPVYLPARKHARVRRPAVGRARVDVWLPRHV